MSGEHGFDEPWQAQALAIATALQDTGVITAAEWAEALGRRRSGDGLRPDGGDYYNSVVSALEDLLASKDIASQQAVSSLAEAWRRAARATPHGRPISLDNDPLGVVDERR
jgi:nitrile hydratase accessory protein